MKMWFVFMPLDANGKNTNILTDMVIAMMRTVSITPTDFFSLNENI